MYDGDYDLADIKQVNKVFLLRHMSNVYDFDLVAHSLGVDVKRVNKVYYSNIRGSEALDFIYFPTVEFNAVVNKFEEMYYEYLAGKEETTRRNTRLKIDLEQARKEFATVGTNKAKRRLNKLSETNALAKAIRIALEIEDKNISAKKYYGKYSDKSYEVKQKLIHELIELFEDEGWVYGVQPSDVPPTNNIVYFEIPNCEQISWHFYTPNELPTYDKEWDGLKNSTLAKLEKVTYDILVENNLIG